ncbi:MAG TPA: FtsX-like permease family protein [Planctomycetota bacterium]|nr:FtsX-like permease family protein [Planctomycetota bacterium]
MGDVWDCAWRELRRRRGRTAANVLGYLLAVATAVVVITALRFSTQAAARVLDSTGTHFVAFAPAVLPACAECSVKTPEEKGEGFVACGVSTHLVPVDLAGKVKQLPAVADASPYLCFRFKDPGDGHSFTVGGFDPRNTTAVGTTCCAATDIVSGRFPRPEEQGVVLLEEAYARLRHAGPGDRVAIAGATFPVVGVVNPGIRPAKADIYMPFRDAEEAINRRLGATPLRGEANVLLVEVASAKVQDEAIRAVRRLHPGLVVSSYACYRPAAQVMGMNEGAAWLLTIIVAVAAVALSLKSQLAAVLERRREIGILKAIGWTDGNIVSQLLAESVLQAALGGLLGCALAAAFLGLAPVGALSGVEGAARVALSPVVMFAGVLLALLGGVVAGAIPALRAARQRPAEALRSI